jgi:hypothetical protein
MAEGSQHHVQIMEDQTRFDLNDAPLRWRRDLAGQPGIAAEDIRELETHLRESFSAFQRRGSSDEKAFAQAREKLGSAGLVGAEFAKAHLLRIWRDRVFWIAFVGYAWVLPDTALWPMTREFLNRLRASSGMTPAVLVGSILESLPFLLICVLMGSGYSEVIYRKFSWLFVRRWRLAVAGMAAAIAAVWVGYPKMGALFIYALGFLGFAIVVMPPEIKAASKCRSLENWRSSLGVWRDRLFWVVLSGLAIAAWTAAIEPGFEAHDLPYMERKVPIPGTLLALFFVTWLVPMGLVGFGLWTGHLSGISRALRSPPGVALIGGVLVLMIAAEKIWLSTWKVTHLGIDWNFEFTIAGAYTLFAGLISIAVTVWALPWQRQTGVEHRKSGPA